MEEADNYYISEFKKRESELLLSALTDTSITSYVIREYYQEGDKIFCAKYSKDEKRFISLTRFTFVKKKNRFLPNHYMGSANAFNDVIHI